jgi:hypothetical protein
MKLCGEKVDDPRARRGAPPSIGVKICCEDKNGPPPGGCVAEPKICCENQKVTPRVGCWPMMRTDFLPNNRFTNG